MRRCWLSGMNYNVDVMSPSGLKGNGLLGWLVAISTTTRCRATCSALTVFGQLSAAYGGKLSSGAASVTDSSGHALVVSQTSTYRSPELHIPIRRNASRHEPEAGAVCGSSARTDLCGGRQVTAVPTATRQTGLSWHLFESLAKILGALLPVTHQKMFRHLYVKRRRHRSITGTSRRPAERQG